MDEQQGQPYAGDDYFEIPPSEQLSNCFYTSTYTYPDLCVNDSGEKIFDSEVDGQEVLDKIVLKQKGKLGEYNKMPPDLKE